MAFPTTLTNAVDGVTDIVSAHLNNLEAKVGIDSSAVVTSLDYLLRSSSSVSPGHRHANLYKSDGSAVALSVDSAGKVGIGIASPGLILHVSAGNNDVAYFDSTANSAGSGAGIYIRNVVAAGATVDNRRNVLFAFYDTGGTLRYTAGFRAIVESITGSSVPTSFAIMTGSTGTTEQMRINSAGNVGVGTAAPNAAALLHLSSTTKGFLPPVMTTTQKAAISTPPEGLRVYDSTLHAMCTYNGTVWKTAAPIESPAFTTPNIGVGAGTSLALTGGFGCNGATIQTAYASGGALAAYVTGNFGLDSDAHMQAMFNLVVAMRAALVANGIMS